MKKLFTTLVLLLACAAMSFAADKTIYLIPGAWDGNDTDEMFVLYSFGGADGEAFSSFTDSGLGYWTATMDDKYTQIVLIRKEAGSTVDWTGLWNQSEDITLGENTVYTFKGWTDGTDGKSSFTPSKLKKVYAKNMQNSNAIKFASWTDTDHYDWPGVAMTTEVVDEQTWYTIALPGVSSIGAFFMSDVENSVDGGQYYKTGGKTLDFSEVDSYFFNYYPDNHQAVLTSEALATPATIYFRANNGAEELKFDKWNDDGIDGLAFSTETVTGVEWLKLVIYKPGISMDFYTESTKSSKSWGKDYTFVAGETSYYFTRLTANTTKIESDYYLVYSDSYTFNTSDAEAPSTYVNHVALTPDGDFKFKTTFDNTSGNYLYYVLIPASVFNTETNAVSEWNDVLSPYFAEDGYFVMSKVEQHTCAILPTTWKRWQINGVKAKYDISFNLATMTWESKPYVEATVTDAGWATYSHADGLNIGDAEAYIIKTVDGNSAELTKLDANSKLPAGTGIILKGEGTYKLYGYTYGDETADVSGNLLVGSGNNEYGISGDFGEEADPRYYSGYIFANGDNGVGFYPVGDDKTLAAHKAFLAVPNGAPAPSFIGFGDVTAIDGIEAAKANVVEGCFNLAGQRVANPTKGLYIVNGKKVVMK